MADDRRSYPSSGARRSSTSQSTSRVRNRWSSPVCDQRNHDPEKTSQQQFRRATDINHIVKRALRGEPPGLVNRQTPLYGDFSHASDLESAMERVQAAEAHFESLPVGVRSLADNDPVKLLAMLDSGEKATLEALRDAGLGIELGPSYLDEEGPIDTSTEGARMPGEKGNEGGNKETTSDDRKEGAR